MKGKIRVFADMDHVKQILLQEGFHDVGILQKRKEGQIFGLAKPLDENLEIHVRGYDDNTLDAEIELSREFLEHVTYKAKPYYGYLINILKNMEFHTKSGMTCLQIPSLLKYLKS